MALKGRAKHFYERHGHLKAPQQVVETPEVKKKSFNKQIGGYQMPRHNSNMLRLNSMMNEK
jgi:hypothetical protein